MPKDVIKKINLSSDTAVVAVTFRCNGGPVVVTVDGEAAKTYTYAADPFFRHRDHYIATGCFLLRVATGSALPLVAVTVQFANMFPKEDQPSGGVSYHLEVSSLPSEKSLIAPADGTLNIGESQSMTFGFLRGA